MARKGKNPFHYTSLVSEDAAAPRPDLETALLTYFKSRQNLLVQGPRRTGKTSLIVDTFRRLEEKKKCWLVEADFFGVQDRQRVIEKLHRAIGRMPLASGLRVKVQEVLGQLREFGFGGFKAGWHGNAKGLEDLLELFDAINKNRPVVVFFDEFQALTEIDDAADVLGSMRSVIQKQPDVFYLFAGSDQNSLRQMFFVEKNPFLKSVSVLEVGPIQRNEFILWLVQRFEAGKRTVEPTVWEPLFDLVDDIPGDVQQVCHGLWEASAPGQTIGLELLEATLDGIAAMQDTSFHDLWSVLATNQKRLLSGIAQMPGVGHTSADFRKRIGIDSTATASRAMDAMLDKGVLWRSGDKVVFSNPFLRYWLLKQDF
ncbi:MAG: ATP-binding protein [Verrucomicrobiota bacterium]